jgi:hypothetical protein
MPKKSSFLLQIVVPRLIFSRSEAFHLRYILTIVRCILFQEVYHQGVEMHTVLEAVALLVLL